jgi:peptidoglycan/LPS O-acetylase OafA/YrhL
MLVVATVIAAVASDELAGRRRSLLASRPMVRLGAASYALYLVHALWLAWFVRHGPPVGTGMTRLAAWAAYAVGAVGLAFVLHHVVEVPCERRLRKLSPLAIPTAKRAPRQRRPQLREVASS